MANHSSVTGWQELFFPYKSFWFLVAVANRCFWSIRLKMYRLPNFNMLFQFLLKKLFKSELFSCLQKVDHVTNYTRWITKQFKVLSQTCNFSISSRGIRFSNSSTYLRIDKSYYFTGGHATELISNFHSVLNGTQEQSLLSTYLKPIFWWWLSLSWTCFKPTWNQKNGV